MRLWRRAPAHSPLGCAVCGNRYRSSALRPQTALAPPPSNPVESSVNKKSKILHRILDFWSRRRDLNPRPLGPEPSALPNCATPRRLLYYIKRRSVLQAFLCTRCQVFSKLPRHSLNKFGNFFLQPLYNFLFQPGDIALRNPQTIGNVFLGHFLFPAQSEAHIHDFPLPLGELAKRLAQ